MEHFFPVAFLCAPFISFSSRNHPSCSRTTPICARGGGRRSKNGYRREKAKSIDLVPEKLPVIEAIWRGATIATSCKYQFIEGRFYFPEADVNWDLLKDSGASGHRNPYGKIQWFDVNVKGSRNKGGAWQFGQLRRPYTQLGGFTAFWKGIVVKQVVMEEADDDEYKDLGMVEAP